MNPLRFVEQKHLFEKRSVLGWILVAVAFALAALFVAYVLKRTLKR